MLETVELIFYNSRMLAVKLLSIDKEKEKSEKMTQSIIDCELHDYLEVACLYGYEVQLTLKDQQTIQGKAKNIITTAEKREFLIVENAQGLQQIELIQLQKLQVITPNAQFTEIIF